MSPPPDETTRLRAELEALREANATLEQQISAVTGMMDAMVDEISAKSRQLEQRSAEQARMSSFFTNVMNTMDSLLLVVDRCGRISQANAATRRNLGLDPANLVGTSPDSLLTDDTLAPLHAASPSFAPGTVLFRSILKQNGLEMETCLHSHLPGAGTCHFMLRATPLYEHNGKLAGAVIVGTDISELRAREQALKASEQRFRDFSAVSSDWFWETDAEMRFTVYTGPDRAGRHLIDIVRGKRRDEFASPEDRLDTAKWADYHNAIARRQSFRDFEYQTLSIDSRPIWFSASGKPCFGSDGKFLGYRGTAGHHRAQGHRSRTAAPPRPPLRTRRRPDHRPDPRQGSRRAGQPAAKRVSGQHVP